MLLIQLFLIHCVSVFMLGQPGEEVDSLEPRESVFEFEDLNLLPVRDVAVFGGGNVTHEFGFTIGPICFS